MRLIHAVLLPAISVFVSNEILLHADALREDETGVFAGRRLRAAASEVFEKDTAVKLGAKISDSMESRAYGPLDELILPLIKFYGESSAKGIFSTSGIDKEFKMAFRKHNLKSKDARFRSELDYLRATFSESDVYKIIDTLVNHKEDDARVWGKDLAKQLAKR